MSLICKAEYQILGYEFLDENMVIRYALSKTEMTIMIIPVHTKSQNTINLDIEGDLFKRNFIRNIWVIYWSTFKQHISMQNERFEGNLKNISTNKLR